MSKAAVVKAFTEYAPTRGIALILSVGLLGWGLWLLLPFEAFVNPIFSLMAELAAESVWGGMFAFAGVTMGIGVWTKDNEWIRRGAFLGFTLWLIISVLGCIADPTASTVISRMTIALMHAWVYIQVKIHPELISGEVSIQDLKDYNRSKDQK